MNKPQEKELLQAKSLLNLESEQAFLKTDLFYQKVIAQIDVCVTRISKFRSIQSGKLNATSGIKHRSRKYLEQNCYAIASLMKSYGCFHAFIPFSDLKGYGKTQLYKYSVLKLLIKSENLKDMLKKYPNECDASGINLIRISKLDAAILDFDSKKDATLKRTKLKRTATQYIDDDIQTIHMLLHKVLMPYMETMYKDEQADLYADFKKVISSYKVRRRKRALQGRITDLDGNPLHRVRISIDGNKAVVKRGVKGYYFFRNLKPGVHQLSFSCDAYQTVTLTVVIAYGETRKLDVVLQALNVLEIVGT